MKITLLCPTKGRPFNARRMALTAIDSAERPDLLHIYYGVDSGDLDLPQVNCIGNAEIWYCPPALDTVTKLHNGLQRFVRGGLVMMVADDMTFNTRGWDEIVRALMPSDQIACIYPNDGATHKCVFPIVSRKWIDLIGYCPEQFNHAYIDTWHYDIAKRIGRDIYASQVLCEHNHFSFGKSEYDETYRHPRRENCKYINQDHKTWIATEHIRKEKAEVLRAHCNTGNA